MNVVKMGGAMMLAWAMVACGGGGGGAAVAAVQPPVMPGSQPPLSGSTGVFDVNYGQFSGIYTFLDNGEFYGVHFVGGGATLAGHPRGVLGAANSVSHLEHISWANFIDDAHMVGKQEADGQFGRSFSTSELAVKIAGSMGTFSATTSVQRGYGDGSAKSLYGDPLPLATLAGTYKGIQRTVGLAQPLQNVGDFVLDAGGNFSTTVLDCTYKGKLVQHGSSGIFDVLAQVSGVHCNMNDTLKGIVTPLSYVGGVARLAVQLDSPDQTQSAVFIVTKS